jgi:hypothetical protein
MFCDEGGKKERSKNRKEKAGGLSFRRGGASVGD